MLNMLSKTNTLPAVRTAMSPAISKGLWGGFEEMDRMFDRLFHDFDQTLGAATWKAPLAVWEDAQNYFVEVELAGVSQDDVDVTVQDRQLVIAYERKIPEGRQFIFNERPYGRFQRTLALPDAVDADSITAEFREGLLRVALRKSPESQPRKIAIQAH